VPVTFGVLTTLTEEQAVMRSVPGADNKGREAALAAVEMATLMRQLDSAVDEDSEELP
jgi:6,7-dimethyl-8-ribityllumazine synthase